MAVPFESYAGSPISWVQLTEGPLAPGDYWCSGDPNTLDSELTLRPVQKDLYGFDSTEDPEETGGLFWRPMSFQGEVNTVVKVQGGDQDRRFDLAELTLKILDDKHTALSCILADRMNGQVKQPKVLTENHLDELIDELRDLTGQMEDIFRMAAGHGTQETVEDWGVMLDEALSLLEDPTELSTGDLVLAKRKLKVLRGSMKGYWAGKSERRG